MGSVGSTDWLEVEGVINLDVGGRGSERDRSEEMSVGEWHTRVSFLVMFSIRHARRELMR